MSKTASACGRATAIATRSGFFPARQERLPPVAPQPEGARSVAFGSFRHMAATARRMASARENPFPSTPSVQPVVVLPELDNVRMMPSSYHGIIKVKAKRLRGTGTDPNSSASSARALVANCLSLLRGEECRAAA